MTGKISHVSRVYLVALSLFVGHCGSVEQDQLVQSVYFKLLVGKESMF